MSGQFFLMHNPGSKYLKRLGLLFILSCYIYFVRKQYSNVSLSAFNCSLILTMVVIGFSCNPKQDTADDFNKESVSREVETMFDNYHLDIKAGGLTAEFKYLDNSSDFFWVPPGYGSALTYDSVRSILEKNAKAFTNIDFHWDTLQIFPISNEVATYSGIVGGTMTDTAGVKSIIKIIESGIVIKRKDGWKLLSGQSAALEADTPAQ